MNITIAGKVDRVQEIPLNDGTFAIRVHVVFPAMDSYEQPPVVEIRANKLRKVGDMVEIPCRLIGYRRSRYRTGDKRLVYPVDNILVEQ